MSTHQMFQVEALCNRIVLIDKGVAVLCREVGEIKRQLRATPSPWRGRGIEHLSRRAEVCRDNGAWHLALETGVSAQDVPRALARRDDVKIKRLKWQATGRHLHQCCQ